VVCADESSYLPAPHQFREVALFSYRLPGWPVADLPSPALNDLPCTRRTDDIVERINGEIHLWWAYLDQPAEDTEKCYEILSEPQAGIGALSRLPPQQTFRLPWWSKPARP
jgi:hypothetical protein